MAALVIGTALAIGALAFVLYPLFFGRTPRSATEPRRATENLALIALREIEFDHVTGKLSDADYAQLKTQYSREALAVMRGQASEAPPETDAPAVVDDATIETVIRSFRRTAAGCPACGPRPEHDALFCSNCGRYLNDRCAGCGTPVEALDARYCVNCGRRLAA